MINGLDLFSGIGGLALALDEWVRPIAYCEIDRYAQGVLLSRMADGSLPTAPIWDDVKTLDGSEWKGRIDIIYGGFPCQDISVAGLGKGLEGERSGLFFEILRLVREIKPSFIFLENVPAIRTRGGERVVKELAAVGYDCRWDHLSAYDVGAPHKRERWFLLAHRNGNGCKVESQSHREESQGAGSFRSHIDGFCHVMANPKESKPPNSREAIPNSNCELIRIEQGRSSGESRQGASFLRDDGEERSLANTNSPRGRSQSRSQQDWSSEVNDGGWWSVEPDVGRVAHGIPHRVDRLKGLGNAVVPSQAREAFMRLTGLKGATCK